MTDMKKILAIMMCALLLAACSKDDEPTVNEDDRQAAEIAAVLNGHFIASTYSEVTNTTEVTEITFRPYAQPKTEEWTENGISKNVVFYGMCEVVTYYNDHLLEVTKEWKYNVRVPYQGAQAELNFYPEIYGLTESHDISVISASSFELDNETFIKQ